MTAVPSPGNRLPGRAREITNRPSLRTFPLASECGVTAGSDVVRPSPAGGEIAVISVDRKGGMGAQGFELCDPISLPQREKPVAQSDRGTITGTISDPAGAEKKVVMGDGAEWISESGQSALPWRGTDRRSLSRAPEPLGLGAPVLPQPSRKPAGMDENPSETPAR